MDNTEPSRVLPAFRAILRRDLLIAIRHPANMANPLIFFMIVVTLVPLGLSPDPQVLAGIAPGIIWVMALLASLLSLEELFQHDYREGVLEQMLISPQPIFVLVLAKVLAHWLTTGMILAVFAPLLGGMLSLPTEGFLSLFLGLLMGTALFSLLGAIGAALTVALRKGGVLLSLIVMPLYVPVLIFGSIAVQRSIDGLPFEAPLAFLGAMLALALVSAPFATAGALRMSLQG